MVYSWVLWWFNGLYCSTGDVVGRSLNEFWLDLPFDRGWRGIDTKKQPSNNNTYITYIYICIVDPCVYIYISIYACVVHFFCHWSHFSLLDFHQPGPPHHVGVLFLSGVHGTRGCHAGSDGVLGALAMFSLAILKELDLGNVGKQCHRPQ